MSDEKLPPAFMCEHANEVPQRCPCETGCYCRSNTCRHMDAEMPPYGFELGPAWVISERTILGVRCRWYFNKVTGSWCNILAAEERGAIVRKAEPHPAVLMNADDDSTLTKGPDRLISATPVIRKAEVPTQPPCQHIGWPIHSNCAPCGDRLRRAEAPTPLPWTTREMTREEYRVARERINPSPRMPEEAEAPTADQCVDCGKESDVRCGGTTDCLVCRACFSGHTCKAEAPTFEQLVEKVGPLESTALATAAEQPSGNTGGLPTPQCTGPFADWCPVHPRPGEAPAAPVAEPTTIEVVDGEWKGPSPFEMYRQIQGQFREMAAPDARIASLEAQLETAARLPPLMYVCAECGPNVAADEDGCCISCGVDAKIEPYRAPDDIARIAALEEQARVDSAVIADREANLRAALESEKNSASLISALEAELAEARLRMVAESVVELKLEGARIAAAVQAERERATAHADILVMDIETQDKHADPCPLVRASRDRIKNGDPAP